MQDYKFLVAVFICGGVHKEQSTEKKVVRMQVNKCGSEGVMCKAWLITSDCYFQHLQYCSIAFNILYTCTCYFRFHQCSKEKEEEEKGVQSTEWTSVSHSHSAIVKVLYLDTMKHV